MAYDRKRDLLFVGMYIHRVRAIPRLSVKWMTLPSQHLRAQKLIIETLKQGVKYVQS